MNQDDHRKSTSAYNHFGERRTTLASIQLLLRTLCCLQHPKWQCKHPSLPPLPSTTTNPPSFPRSSYYTRDYLASPALLRARRPYLLRNTLTGFGIFTFVIGVYAYTIKAVAQDEFSDVVVPDTPREQAQGGARGGVGIGATVGQGLSARETGSGAAAAAGMDPRRVDPMGGRALKA